ncbi:MAG TPA: class D sortase [Anaerolineales bacterium]|nr:class D sortase [Anaerolineales bacterium]
MKLADRLLLGLELGMVLGFAVIVLMASQALTTINQQSAVAQYTPPAPTATALIRLVELPAGNHIHPEAESLEPPTPIIPPAVKLVVTARPLPPVVLPTSEPQHATRISIPALGVEAPVVHGVEPDDLKLGVGHYEGSVNPGEKGNLALAGHNDAYGEVFRDLIELQPGDEVTVYTASSKYRYLIRGSRLVEPDEVSVLEPTVGPTITLISCYPYLVDTQRIVVFGELID